MEGHNLAQWTAQDLSCGQGLNSARYPPRGVGGRQIYSHQVGEFSAHKIYWSPRYSFLCEKKKKKAADQESLMSRKGKSECTFQSGKQSVNLLHGFLLPCPAVHIYLDNPGQRFPRALYNPGWARNCKRVFFFLQEKGGPDFQPHKPTGWRPIPFESSTGSQMLVKARQGCGHHPGLTGSNDEM